MSHEEILDVVDKDDNVIGQEYRSKLYKAGSTQFRVINAFVKNNRGQIWIPRRTAHKSLFPLCLDVSVGGHVSSGESYEEAFYREVEEEINLKRGEVNGRLLGHLKPHEAGVSAFMHVYEIQLNETPDYNRDDFVESFWLKPADVLTKIEQGDVAKGDLPKLLQIFYPTA